MRWGLWHDQPTHTNTMFDQTFLSLLFCLFVFFSLLFSWFALIFPWTCDCSIAVYLDEANVSRNELLLYKLYNWIEKMRQSHGFIRYINNIHVYEYEMKENVFVVHNYVFNKLKIMSIQKLILNEHAVFSILGIGECKCTFLSLV